ncbi:hypothetical protein COO60DRAFT_177303 [Scenedesmus sp. NREL 46B-D3]|nr:hypothetical protein COO60DRAFT_177303 [Scenedesmus sp. NREL 46B-D3]
MQFLQTDAGKLAVQRLTQQFQQQHRVRDWQEFLQSPSAQHSLLNLQQLYNQTAGSPVQQQQEQGQQLPTLQLGHHQLAGSRLRFAAPALPGQQQQQQQQMFGRLSPLPAGTRTSAAAAESSGQQLGHTQWLQQQPALNAGQPGSRPTSLQLALSAGASTLPAAAAAGPAAAAAAAAARRLRACVREQAGQAAAAHCKPRTSNAGAGPHLLSRGSSGHSDGSTYRPSRSTSPEADDSAAAAAAAAGEAGRGRSVSADSGRGTAAAAAGADTLAAMHAAAVAGMFAAPGAHADNSDAHAARGEEEADGAAGAGPEVLLGGGRAKRHSARPKRQTERMQEMQQQLKEQHKQRKPKQQQEQQEQYDEQLLQDLWAVFGESGLPGQLDQELLQPLQQEQPPLQREQQQQMKRKRVNLAWKPAGNKASSASAAPACSADAAAAAGSTANDDTAAAAADGGRVPVPVMKATGPGCVSHAQNPTGQMGVRKRRSKYEAFIAVPPFRYLYLGQHTTAAEAVHTRDTAMLAIYGPEAAAAHGAAWLSPGAAGSVAAGDVAALAAKLVKKEQVAGVMKQHGVHRVLQAGTAGAVADGAAAQE